MLLCRNCIILFTYTALRMLHNQEKGIIFPCLSVYSINFNISLLLPEFLIVLPEYLPQLPPDIQIH